MPTMTKISDMTMEEKQEEMNRLCEQAFLFHVTRYPDGRPVLTDEEREFTAKGYESLAATCREIEASGGIPIFHPPFLDNLVACIRNDWQ